LREKILSKALEREKRMQINNLAQVSFGTKLDIKPQDMVEMQKVANPYFSRIAGDLKALKEDKNDHDVLEIRNVKVHDGNDETSFLAELALYNDQMPEYRATRTVSVNGMDGQVDRGRLYKIHSDLKQKLDDMLTLTANMITGKKD
jgi:hypothetical protein